MKHSSTETTTYPQIQVSAPSLHKIGDNFEALFRGTKKLLKLNDDELKNALIFKENKYNFDKLKEGLQTFHEFMLNIKNSKSSAEIETLFSNAKNSVDFVWLPLDESTQEIDLNLGCDSSDIFIKLKSDTELDAENNWCGFKTFRSHKNVLYVNISPYIKEELKEGDSHYDTDKWGEFKKHFSKIDSFAQELKNHIKNKYGEDKIKEISPFLKLQLGKYAMIERHLEQEYIPYGDKSKIADEVVDKEIILSTYTFALDISSEDKPFFQKIARLAGVEGLEVIPSFIHLWNNFVKDEYKDYQSNHPEKFVSLYSSAHVPEQDISFPSAEHEVEGMQLEEALLPEGQQLENPLSEQELDASMPLAGENDDGDAGMVS